jgi:1,4-dihydroxy-2-naphthoyl-CoA hydrolase
MAPLIYKYSFTSRMHDIDAAGVMFFGRFFYHAHDAYEAFLEHQNISIQKLLAINIALPICHSEAQFKAPIYLNEHINIDISLAQKNVQKFTLDYQFFNQDKTLLAILSSTHVCINQQTKVRETLPDLFHHL